MSFCKKGFPRSSSWGHYYSRFRSYLFFNWHPRIFEPLNTQKTKQSQPKWPDVKTMKFSEIPSVKSLYIYIPALHECVGGVWQQLNQSSAAVGGATDRLHVIRTNASIWLEWVDAGETSCSQDISVSEWNMIIHWLYFKGMRLTFILHIIGVSFTLNAEGKVHFFER